MKKTLITKILFTLLLFSATVSSTRQANLDSTAWENKSKVVRQRNHRLLQAAENGNLDEVKLLVLENIACIDCRDSENCTPLILAAGAKQSKSVYNKKTNNTFSESVPIDPYEWAQQDVLDSHRNSYSDIIEFLIEKNANTNWRNNAGRTAFMEAVKNGNHFLAFLLEKFSNDWDGIDKDGNGVTSVAEVYPPLFNYGSHSPSGRRLS